MKYALYDTIKIGEYLIEYSNFNIYIKKNNSLIKCIDVKRDFTTSDYNAFIRKFQNKYVPK